MYNASSFMVAFSLIELNKNVLIVCVASETPKKKEVMSASAHREKT